MAPDYRGTGPPGWVFTARAACRKIGRQTMSTAETLIAPQRSAWPRVAAVLATLAAGGGMAVGHPEPALAAAVVGLGAIAIGLRSRQAIDVHAGLDLVRSITGRAASAERLDGTISTTL